MKLEGKLSTKSLERVDYIYLIYLSCSLVVSSVERAYNNLNVAPPLSSPCEPKQDHSTKQSNIQTLWSRRARTYYTIFEPHFESHDTQNCWAGREVRGMPNISAFAYRLCAKSHINMFAYPCSESRPSVRSDRNALGSTWNWFSDRSRSRSVLTIDLQYVQH